MDTANLRDVQNGILFCRHYKILLNQKTMMWCNSKGTVVIEVSDEKPTSQT